MKPKVNSVLLIDDDEPTNFINSLLFEEANCTLHLEIAESGTKALDYLRKAFDHPPVENHFVPDLIFLDINMPRMNGWEFLNHYRKLGFMDRVKSVIIMLTTSLNPDDRARAEEMPEIAGFENKPLTVEIIERVIHTHFEYHMKAEPKAA